MNILIDVRPLMDERYSGVAEYTYELLSALFKIDSSNQYFLYYNSARDLLGRLPNFTQANVSYIRTHYPNKIFNYCLVMPFDRPRLDRYIGSGIDIFFMPHVNFSAWSPSVKSVVAVHDLSFLIYPEVFNWRKNIWHGLLRVRRLMKKTTAVVAVSENTKADIINYGGAATEKVKTILSGLSADFKKLPPEDPALLAVKKRYRLPEKFIFFLSTVEPRKNIECLLRAFDLLKKKPRNENIKLLIAGGRGWKSKAVYSLAKKLACSSDIEFLDYVDRNDKVYLYNAATLFAYPSLYEGFGHPPLEAMACGTPTILGSSSSLPEVAGDAALLVDPYNPTALAAAIESIIMDADLAAALSEKGIEQAKRFTWEKTARQYLDLFESL